MKTELEIEASTLEEKQKLVIELRAVPTNDKFYAAAKAIIAFTVALDDWEEPKLIEVTAKSFVAVDGKTLNKGDTAKVFAWQYQALRRFLTGPDDAKKKKDAGPVASLIIAALLFAFGFTASAQTQAIVYGSKGSYVVYSIAGLYGGTNSLQGTNTFYAGVITTNTIIAPSILLSNGVAYNNPVTNYTYVTNVPGLLSVPNFDLVNLSWGFNLLGAGTATAGSLWDYSNDGSLWTSNALSLTLTGAGTALVSTNVALTGFGPGFLRLNTAWYANATNAMTNLWFTIGLKSSKTGP